MANELGECREGVFAGGLPYLALGHGEPLIYLPGGTPNHHNPPPEVVPTVTLNPGRNGAVKAHVTLDPLAAEYFTTALDAAHCRMSFATGTSLAQRRAAGLVGISRFFLENHKHLHHRLGRPHTQSSRSPSPSSKNPPAPPPRRTSPTPRRSRRSASR